METASPIMKRANLPNEPATDSTAGTQHVAESAGVQREREQDAVATTTRPAPTAASGIRKCVVKCNSELYRWKDEAERRASVVLVDLIPDASDSHLHIGIDAVFNAVPFRVSGFTGRSDFYIAATGGRIHVEVARGAIGAYTEAIEVATKYELSREDVQQAALTIEPLKLDSAPAGGGAPQPALPKLEVKAGVRRASKCAFTAKERVLQPTYTPPFGLRWDLRSLRGEKAVSDFVSGNLYLFAQVAWSDDAVAGKIEVIPDRVDVYNADRRRLSQLKSAVICLYLAAKNYKVFNKDGVTIRFDARKDWST